MGSQVLRSGMAQINLKECNPWLYNHDESMCNKPAKRWYLVEDGVDDYAYDRDGNEFAIDSVYVVGRCLDHHMDGYRYKDVKRITLKEVKVWEIMNS
jgi:hypothetical protein